MDPVRTSVLPGGGRGKVGGSSLAVNPRGSEQITSSSSGWEGAGVYPQDGELGPPAWTTALSPPNFHPCSCRSPGTWTWAPAVHPQPRPLGEAARG